VIIYGCLNLTQLIDKFIKGTVSVISSNPPCKNGNAWLITVPKCFLILMFIVLKNDYFQMRLLYKSGFIPFLLDGFSITSVSLSCYSYFMVSIKINYHFCFLGLRMAISRCGLTTGILWVKYTLELEHWIRSNFYTLFTCIHNYTPHPFLPFYLLPHPFPPSSSPSLSSLKKGNATSCC